MECLWVEWKRWIQVVWWIYQCAYEIGDFSLVIISPLQDKDKHFILNDPEEFEDLISKELKSYLNCVSVC